MNKKIENNFANRYDVAMSKLLKRLKREEMIELFTNQIQATPFKREEGLIYLEMGCKLN